MRATFPRTYCARCRLPPTAFSVCAGKSARLREPAAALAKRWSVVERRRRNKATSCAQSAGKTMGDTASTRDQHASDETGAKVDDVQGTAGWVQPIKCVHGDQQRMYMKDICERGLCGFQRWLRGASSVSAITESLIGETIQEKLYRGNRDPCTTPRLHKLPALSASTESTICLPR